MNEHAIYHISSGSYCYPVGGTTLRVRLRLARDEALEVRLHYQNIYDHKSPFFSVAMGRLFSDRLFDYFEAEISLEWKRFKYFFEIAAGGDRHFFGSEGLTDAVKEKECFFYPYINGDDVAMMPEWARGEIIYQIWVDRFWNGDQSNDPEGAQSPDVLPDRDTYYGGDFDGVMRKLPYIRDLGAGIIYLNPVFDSPSYHKYDIRDYAKIDAAYGSKEKLRQLVDKAHGMGIRVILDGVFNHCSSENALFADVVNRGEESPYRSWFCIDSFPVTAGQYDSFGGLVPSMPRFNTSDPGLIEYLTDIADYWTGYLGIDGWRLDVADEVSHRLWREFRRRLCGKYPDILLLGEIWNQAAPWLDGSGMHTATNYRYRKYALAFSSGAINSRTFWEKYNADNSLYRTTLYDYRVNLMGSHDTARLLHVAGDKRRALLLQVLTLTLKGMPLIYYGDEIPMEGGEDPDNRRAMRWERINSEFHDRIRQIGVLRRDGNALRKGTQEIRETEPRVLAFIRTYGEERVAAALNFGSEPSQVEFDGATWTLRPLDYRVEPL